MKTVELETKVLSESNGAEEQCDSIGIDSMQGKKLS
jgi:hypothetical protein